MAAMLERTCWRGMQMEHPAEWELALASGLEEEGRCVFADRYFQRLDVRWKNLKYVPDMKLMLEKFRQKTQEKLEISDLKGAPEPWQGVVRKAPTGCTVNAGRFFKEQRLLVEATIVWPRKRDTGQENLILKSIAPQENKESLHWRAFGIDLLMPRRMDLLTSNARVGRITWTFGQPKKSLPRLVVERIAMPDYWLRQSLGDWLAQELPLRCKKIKDGPFSFNGHDGRMLLSRTKISTVSSLRGLRRIRLDAAWKCPKEDRVYRVAYMERKRERALNLPADFQMACCKVVPAVAQLQSPQADR